MAKLKLKDTLERLTLLIRAGYPVLYIVSHEEARVRDFMVRIWRLIRNQEVNGLANRATKNFIRWDLSTGFRRIVPAPALADANLPPEAQLKDWLRIPGEQPENVEALVGLQNQGGGTPEEHAKRALESIGNAVLQNFQEAADSLCIFFDVHPYLDQDAYRRDGGIVIRALRNAAAKLRQNYRDHAARNHRYKTLVIVAPTGANLAMELEQDIIRIDFPLPEVEELRHALERRIEAKDLSFPAEIPEGETTEEETRSGNPRDAYEKGLVNLIAAAGRGLPLEDYQLGLNMFKVRGQDLRRDRIEDMLNLKAKAINNQALEYSPHVEIELGGLEKIKEWIRNRRRPVTDPDIRKQYHLPPSRGVLLVGASGGGKSQLAKLIAKEFGLALLRLDVGSLFGSYVGESEERTRRALNLAEVLSPVVLWIDELDKAFRGIGAGDNGVSARVLGYFLTWLAEKQDDVFVVATANDFQELNTRFPEFFRKGRFDEIFWLGLPKMEARWEILKIYLAPERDLLKLDDVDPAEVANYLVVSADPPPRRPPNAPDARLWEICWILAQDIVSGSMTGAELEYAVAEGKREIYNRLQKGLDNPAERWKALGEKVRESRSRALYTGNSDERGSLDALERVAIAKQWLLAE